MAITKILRSFIHEKFPLELRVQLDILSRRRDIQNKPKHEKLLELLREYNVGNIVQLGPGTNRYAIRLDGFVVKFATDGDGKIDNFKEFKMAKVLYPYVAKTYEVSENGTILIAEYIQPFDTYPEMLRYADQIRSILTKLSAVYLIGDVGISSKNFKNWGIRTGTDDPVCLDFAYVYEVSSELFICRKCKNDSMLVPNKDFTELYCPAPGCGKRYTFEEIRGRLSDESHMKEIGDLSSEGYRMYESNTLVTLDENRSNYLALKKPKHQEEEQVEIEEEDPFDNFSIDHPPTYYINNGFNNKGGTIMKTSNDYEKSLEMARDLAKGAAMPAMPMPRQEAPATRVPRTYVAKSYSAADMKQDCVSPAPNVTKAEPVKVSADKVQYSSLYGETKNNDDIKNTADNGSFGPSVVFTVDPVQVDDEPTANIEDEMAPSEDQIIVEAEESIDDIPDDTDDAIMDIEMPGGRVIPKEVLKQVELETNSPVEEVNPGAVTTPEIISHVDPKFLPHLGRALSKLGNLIKNDLYVGEELYDDVRDGIRDAKLYAENFYGIIQNAVYRSLTIFLNMVKVEAPNNRGEGTHTIWEAPEVIDPAVEPTVVYLQRLWNARDITSITSWIERNYRYNQRWTDCRGIQAAWLPILRERLTTKFGSTVDNYVIDEIIDAIDPICVDPATKTKAEAGMEPVTETIAADDDFKLPVEVEQPSTDEIMEEVSDDGMTQEEAAEKAFMEAFGRDEQKHRLTSEERNVIQQIQSGYSCGCEHGDCDSESEDECDEGYPETVLSPLTVEIFEEDDFDVIKINSEDAFGDISIPIYVKLDEINIDTPAPSLIDDRNGYWDWLVHMVPDAIFTTSNPEKWLDINNLELNEDSTQIRMAILDKDPNTGKCTMGAYYIDGVYMVDTDYDRHFSDDPTLLKKINTAITRTLNHSMISHLRKSLSNTEVIYDEESFSTELAPILEAHRAADEAEEAIEAKLTVDDQVSSKLTVTPGNKPAGPVVLSNGSVVTSDLKTDHLSGYVSNTPDGPSKPQVIGSDGVLNIIRRGD